MMRPGGIIEGQASAACDHPDCSPAACSTAPGGAGTAPVVPDWDVSRARVGLLDADLPNGFRYREDFITSDEEASCADAIARVELFPFEMRGVVARRRVAFFGGGYETSARSTPPLPSFLMPLRDKLAGWAGVDPPTLAMALINEYTPGAPIGWHRDAPQYDIVAGLSLLSSCRMKFRPYVRPEARVSPEGRRRTATHEITLERRSAYLLTGEARNAYEHHIPAVATLRYSVTFRTLRSAITPA
jgi:alkylated DNA repair dioxygenase AlkB